MVFRGETKKHNFETNKNLIIVKKTKEVFKQSADEAGKPITDLQAEEIVANALKDPKLPKGFRLDKPSDVIFQTPDFFVNRTALDDAVKRGGVPRISIGNLESAADRKVFNDLFGNCFFVEKYK